MRKSVRLTDVSLTLFALPLMVFMRLLSDRHNKPVITECIRGNYRLAYHMARFVGER